MSDIDETETRTLTGFGTIEVGVNSFGMVFISQETDRPDNTDDVVQIPPEYAKRVAGWIIESADEALSGSRDGGSAEQ